MRTAPDAAFRFNPYAAWFGLALAFLGICLTPLFWPRLYDSALILDRPTQNALLIGMGMLPVAAGWFALHGAAMIRRERIIVCFLCVASAGICEVIHYRVTDHGHYFPVTQFADNTAWELYMHQGILALRPDFLPHSYRFLPDCIIRILTAFSGSFEFSRICYRLVFNSLFFVAVFRYARVYVSFLSANAVVLVIVALYPISILKYAGQFVDPISHLSFAACLFFLARKYEPGFGPALFVGLFAKESVLVMALCRAFAGPSLPRAAVLALAYLTGAVAIVAAIRFGVNHGHMGYGQISGVGLSQVMANFAGYREWGLLYVASFGALLPGAVLGWKYMDREFQATCLVVVSAVIVSSIFFSWLSEVRNMVPAFIVLAVINLRYAEKNLAPQSAMPVR